MKGGERERCIQEMEYCFNTYHQKRFGVGCRNDLIAPKVSYEIILQQYFDGKYVSFSKFLHESFEPFCIGYLQTDHEKTVQQYCPIAWGIKDGRYSYYEQLGKGLDQKMSLSSQELQHCLYITFNSNSIDKTVVLQKGYNLYQQIFQVAHTILSPQIAEFFFSNALQYEGTELVYRLVITCPWEENSPLYGEFYKYLVNNILPSLGEQCSIRLVQRKKSISLTEK
jgi:hypothetical protein